MEVSKRIFNLETETAFSILAKANNLAAKGKDIINLLPVIIINKKLIIIEKFKYSFKEGKYFEILNDSIM